MVEPALGSFARTISLPARGAAKVVPIAAILGLAELIQDGKS